MNTKEVIRRLVVFIIAFSLTHLLIPVPIVSLTIAGVLACVSSIGRMLVGVGSGIGIFLIALYFTNTLLTDKIVGFHVAIIVTALIYFRWVFPHVSAFVPPDRAWIMANRFKQESSVRQTTFSGFRDIVAQKDFQPGFRWKYPWEELNIEIDLTRKVTVENDPNRAFTLSDGNIVMIHWRRFFMPLPNYGVNYIKIRPGVIERKLIDDTNRFIQGYVGGLRKIEFGEKQQEKFRKVFESKHGGPVYLDEVEKAHGIWTDTPEIIDMDQPRSAQEIRTILKTVQDMVRESNGKMTVEEARGIILAHKASGVDVDYIELAKNVGLTGK